MADDFDPCECVYNHEGTMRRLISLLRNSQGYCTTDECFANPPGPVGSGPGDGMGMGNTMMMLMMGWALVAMLLYFTRPSSLAISGDEKPSQERRQPPPDSSVQ